eukprot:3550731-Amphidinium_carterae.4
MVAHIASAMGSKGKLRPAMSLLLLTWTLCAIIAPHYAVNHWVGLLGGITSGLCLLTEVTEMAMSKRQIEATAEASKAAHLRVRKLSKAF